MNTRSVIISALMLMSVISSCKKDDTDNSPLQVELSTRDSVANGNINEAFIVTATIIHGTDVKQSWKVNDSLYSTLGQLSFTPKTAGIYKIIYTATGTQGTKIINIILSVNVPLRPITASSSKYISQVFDYLPAPGQFVNESLGIPDGAKKLVGSSSSLVSLGSYGGYIIAGFDHSILNKDGNDLGIFGNPSFGTNSNWSEPGIVMVMQDANGNGLPDDTWYELAGSEYSKPETIKNYRITYYNPGGTLSVAWKDNQGSTGAVPANTFHKHNFYPLFAANQDSISFTGTLLKNTFIKRVSFENDPLEWGYSDNASADYISMATPRYNSFDISWAVDNKGNKMALSSIDFVKVYTGQNCTGSALLGEVSTEVSGIMDLGIK